VQGEYQEDGHWLYLLYTHCEALSFLVSQFPHLFSERLKQVVSNDFTGTYPLALERDVLFFLLLPPCSDCRKMQLLFKDGTY
jgi:hypothetical protein